MRVAVVLIAIFGLVVCDDGIYSYQSFKGPVSGQVQEVVVPGQYQNQKRIDFVAKPDYLYQYEVEDPQNGNSQLHREAREGDDVLGEYKVLQPDGYLRVVKYKADGVNGFKAIVNYIKI